MRKESFPRCPEPPGPGLTEGVIIVPAPSNYDDSGMLIRVDPDTLFGYATVDMVNEADVIANAISSIVEIWNGLKLGWVGTTAAEAQDFSNRWNHAVQLLFGTEKDPASGVLPKIAQAVAIASINYGEAEDTVMEMFKTLTDGLNAPPGTPGPPTRGQDQGPVTENAPRPA